MTPTLPQLEIQPEALPETHALHALLTSAAFAPLPNLGWLRVTGSDRVRWLNGMVTNNIADLKPGQGCYSFVLNAQGRIQADLTAFALPDELMLETSRDRLPGLIALLDRFIIMDDVELSDVSDDGPGLTLIGPNAVGVLQQLGILQQAPPPLKAVRGHFQGQELTVIHAHGPLVPRFELLPKPETLPPLTDALQAAGIAQATPESLEHLRLLEGTPLYGTDIRNSETAKDLPQETAQSGVPSRALHFAKGCYLGQEIVERIRSRGNVHRTFAGFLLTGALPPVGTALTAAEAPEKSIGELTSVASIPLPSGPIQLALGYIRREALERGAARSAADTQPILYPGGTATPVTLPFVAASQTASSASDSQNPQE